MAENDAQLKYFSEALKVRGIDSEPWKLEAFAEKKELGQSEAEIIRQAGEGTRAFKSGHFAQRLLGGTAIGAVAAPILDGVKSGRSSWTEVARRSPKTAAIGAGMGAAVGWAASVIHDLATRDALANRWSEFKRTTHEMDLAWTEALAKRLAEGEASVSKENGPTR